MSTEIAVISPDVKSLVATTGRARLMLDTLTEEAEQRRNPVRLRSSPHG